ncbi:MAG: polyprenyl synthetase family protein [bacterium]|nr:polyprenyl synthetase family protein [bacterium]
MIKRVRNDTSLLDKIGDLTPVARGKKIRSTLLFLLAGMNGTMSPAMALPEIAASIEMFHLSSLIHDDVMDDSKLRRGAETLQNNLGNTMTVLWGDYLFIDAFIALNNIGKKFLMDIIFESAKWMVEGQIIELGNTFNFKLEEEKYYEIVNKKTSALFAGVTQIAAALKDEPEDVQEKYYQVGMDFGTIFQVSDDMLDIFSENSGKDRFSDLKEGKITLPIILLQKVFKKDIATTYSQQDPEGLVALFDEYNTKELCLEVIGKHSDRVSGFLNDFPDSIYKESALRLLDFIKYRDY